MTTELLGWPIPEAKADFLWSEEIDVNSVELKFLLRLSLNFVLISNSVELKF